MQTDQEKKANSRKRMAQDLLPILLMLFGIGLTVTGYGSFGFIYPVGGLALIIAGALSGMAVIVRRDIAKQGKPGLLAVMAGLCWLALIVSIVLLFVAPGIYGYDLAILVNSFAAMAWSGLLGMVFTIVALLK